MIPPVGYRPNNIFQSCGLGKSQSGVLISEWVLGLRNISERGAVEMRGYLYAGLTVVILFSAVFFSQAATNLNSSKSNVNRLIYPADTVSPAQAAAILADLDTATKSGGRVNLEGAVNEALKKQGLETKIKKIIIKPASARGQLTTIIILSNPADEAQAIAVADEGVPADKPTKGKRTN
jgi:hypothetical protein